MNFEETHQAFRHKIIISEKNIFKFIPWCNVSQEEANQIMRRTCVWNYIQPLKVLNRIGKTQEYQVYLGQFKDRPCYYQILKEISFVKRISAFQIWNSEITSKFFIFLSKGSWTCKVLKFTTCNLNNINVDFIRYLKTETILQLSFDSDPIGNAGLKLIMKNSMPMLRLFKFSNTKMTTDGIKLLKKTTSKALTKLQLSKYSKMNASELLKGGKISGYSLHEIGPNFELQCWRNSQGKNIQDHFNSMDLINSSHKGNVQLTITPSKQGMWNHFIYFGLIFKFKLSLYDRPSLYIIDFKCARSWKNLMLISKNNYRILQKFRFDTFLCL